MSNATLKVLLASALEMDDLPKLKFPRWVSPKLDGVRVVILNGVVLSRNMKPIRNEYVQKLFGRRELNGFDGELVVGAENINETYSNTVSGVMSQDGEPDVALRVFDIFDMDAPFNQRYQKVGERVRELRDDRITRVAQYEVNDAEQLLQMEEQFLNDGYEGMMVRDPLGRYKNGRSSLREGILLKFKRFSDAEAEIIGYEQLFSNQNEAKRDALGRTERSSHKENMVAMGTLGALLVRGVAGSDYDGVEFSIGSGYDAATRQSLWDQRESLIGKIVKYKHFPIGVKTAPRFPIYLGFRDPIDM